MLGKQAETINEVRVRHSDAGRNSVKFMRQLTLPVVENNFWGSGENRSEEGSL